MLESIDFLKVLIFALLGGYASFLANKAIAVYHDGLRPIMPEFMSGNMSRKELAGVSFAISIGFITGFALPISIASGIIVIHIILLAADFIGVSIGNSKLSVAVGTVYGGIITLVLDVVIKSFQYLPVNFLDALSAVGMPVIYAFVAFPAISVAYQFSVRKGIFTLLASLAGQIAIEAINPVIIAGKEVSLSPQGIALLVGMTFLLVYSARDKSVGINIENSVFEENINRIKGNAKYLLPMGALLAVAANYHWIAGEPIAGALLGEGKVMSAAIVAIVQALAFMPLIVTTSMISGVYGTNGWCDWLLGAGYLAPNPVVAAGAGAVLMGVEIKSLSHIGKALHRFPALKESGDNIRTAMTGILEIALLVGGINAANDIWEGVGMFTVVALYILNEIAGRPVMKMAAAPLGAIVVGIAANIAAILGLIQVAS
ncbi:TPA: YhfT family protein [Salmonella enterica subsp. enterica serovar Muenchen]|uniref:Transporter n=1 Tax=Salmonella enterica TaxID=28901 RepID=A0A742L2M1_SALER|nr:transporter [Salmonella enterica subsp. enterica serovar Gatow]ECG6808322.1 transporter [Salmonella enterica subsp. enterica serovar Muenchen]EDV9210825.1 transporter [Salmonella enterica subsp. enterica serovar Oranienburg]EGL1840533.1 transporter [Salmonella enterica]HCM6306594.1 transporter [Salmonella enterica subsp. enterica serovar 6,14:y:1,7]